MATYRYSQVQHTYKSCDGYNRLYRKFQLASRYIDGAYAPHYPVPCVYYGKDNPQFWAFRFKFEARYKMRARQ